MMENQKSTHLFVLFPLGTSPSNELFTAGSKTKWEVRHNTGKFQEKEGGWKDIRKLRIGQN